jgi:hypothetical protein
MPSEDLVVQNAPDADVAARVRRAVQVLLEVDALLFKVDANERSLTHRLALHLTPVFPDWDVDCEYNRKGFDQKKIIHVLRGEDELNGTNGSRVFPDIVVHRRTKPANLLVIEVKKSTSNQTDDADLNKLRLLREQLGYIHALFLRFVCEAETPAVEKAVWC